MSVRENTTLSYRRGFVEGESGERNAYLLEAGCTDIDEYNRGFADGLRNHDGRTLIGEDLKP